MRIEGLQAPRGAARTPRSSGARSPRAARRDRGSGPGAGCPEPPARGRPPGCPRRRATLRAGLLAAVVLLAFAAGHGTGRGQHLVKDIRPGNSEPRSSNPRALAVGSTGLLFTAGDALWITDGRANGTRRLAAGHFDDAVAVHGHFIVGGTDALWLTEGRPERTFRLARVGGARAMQFDGQRIYFLADDHVWSAMPSAFWADRMAPTPGELLVAHGHAWFPSAPTFDPTRRVPVDLEPWRSDGTRPGTLRAADVRAGWVGSWPGGFVAIDAGVVFTADDGVHGRELWLAPHDGSPPRLAVDLRPGPEGSAPRDVVALDDETVLFVADDGRTGSEPWLYHPVRGAALLCDLAPGLTGSESIVQAVTDDGVVFVTARTTSRGNPPTAPPRTAWWLAATGGLPATPHVLAPSLVAARDFEPAPGGCWFIGDDGVHGEELWWFDRARGAAEMFRDHRAGPAPGALAILGTTDGRCIVAADDGSTGFEPWSASHPTSSAPSSMQLLVDAVGGGTADGAPRELTALDVDRAVFSADGPGTGREVWVTDGREQGTREVADVFPGREASEPGGFTRIGPLGPDARAIFSADDGRHGREPWVTDGTAAGTALLADLAPRGSEGSAPYGFVAAWLPRAGGDVVVFRADDGRHGDEPWVTDGTPGGTRKIADLFPGRLGSAPDRNGGSPSTILVAAHGVLFLADDGATGPEICISDGTAQGTHLLDLVPFRGGSDPVLLGSDGQLAWFSAVTPAHGRELYVSDGTLTGTRLVADLRPQWPGSFPRDLSILDDGTVLVSADDGQHGREWWVVRDATSGIAPRLLVDIGPGLADGVDGALAVTGEGLVFAADDGRSGSEPWVTDGTAHGTRRLADLEPGAAGSRPGRPSARFGTGAEFVLTTLAGPGAGGGSGRQVHTAWIRHSDGSLRRAPNHSGVPTWLAPDGFVQVGDLLLYAAGTPGRGRELWAMPLPLVGAGASIPRGTGCRVASSHATARFPARLDASGVPQTGNRDFALHMRDAAPASYAGLVLGTGLGGRRLHGLSCRTLVSEPIAGLPAVTTAQGTATWNLPIPPDPALVGAKLYAQAGCVDAHARLADLGTGLLLVVGSGPL